MNMIKCAVCGKQVSPYEAYQFVRRSTGAMASTTDLSGVTWEFFTVAPVFFACSKGHYDVALAQWRLMCAQQSIPMFELPEGDGPETEEDKRE